MKAYPDENKIRTGANVLISGINIGNALEAPVPGAWGVTIKPEYFKKIHDAGFNTIRLPVRFSAHLNDKPSYKIEPGFLNSVSEIVNSGLKNNLIVILDVHHFNEIMEDPAGEERKLFAIWEQLSDHFQGYSEYLFFEILNEPSKNLDKDKWNELIAGIIKVIREKNPNRWILIDSSDFSTIEMLPALRLPEDNHVMATFHFYEPFPFTHQGASWVDGAYNWQSTEWQGSNDEKQAITRKLDRAAAWSRESKVPLVMGEFGAIEKADKKSRILWTEFLAREAEKRNIGWIHWQFCSDFPIYSCKSDQWDNEMLHALILK